MRDRPRASRPAVLGAVFVLILTGTGAAEAPVEAPDRDGPETTSEVPFARPHAKTAKRMTREILADPRFKEPSLADEAWRCMAPGTHLVSGACLEVVAYTACGVILVAFVWWLVRYLAGRTPHGPVTPTSPAAVLPHFQRAADMSAADLMNEARQAADEGRHRDAVRLVMLAALKRLDERDLVRFHPSKTGGDYVREFPPARPGRKPLRQLVAAFDRAAYGAAPCGPEDWARVRSLTEELAQDAATETL